MNGHRTLALLAPLTLLPGCSHDVGRFVSDLTKDRGVDRAVPMADGGVDARADGTTPPADSTTPPADRATPDAPPVTCAWQTGPWGACSKPCDGGTRVRDVQCACSVDAGLGESGCTAPKPAASESCNAHPCCSTDALQSGRRCDGDEKVQWVHWGSDKGDAADRASCADACTAWAKSNSYALWCCQLYEDSSAGTNWVCRVYDSHSTFAGTSINYSGLGQCQ